MNTATSPAQCLGAGSLGSMKPPPSIAARLTMVVWWTSLGTLEAGTHRAWYGAGIRGSTELTSQECCKGRKDVQNPAGPRSKRRHVVRKDPQSGSYRATTDRRNYSPGVNASPSERSSGRPGGRPRFRPRRHARARRIQPRIAIASPAPPPVITAALLAWRVSWQLRQMRRLVAVSIRSPVGRPQSSHVPALNGMHPSWPSPLARVRPKGPRSRLPKRFVPIAKRPARYRTCALSDAHGPDRRRLCVRVRVLDTRSTERR
jgi:hypothetical protein